MNPIKIITSAKSFAIIGASREPRKVGYQLLANLRQNAGLKLYPVNPNARSILNLPVYRNILDIEDRVDVALIAVPVPFVPTVIEECIEKKVKAVILITAGFSELSRTGRKLQEDIKQQLAEAGIALLGPNTLGVIAPHTQINASFADKYIAPGSLGLISQSGAMLTAMFTEMKHQNLGCSFAVSLGNKAGITENDALQYAAQDPKTKVIALYLESFSNIPEFFALCSEIVKTKPILLLKGGRSKRGQSASVSHTAALTTNYVLLKAAQPQAGFVLADTIQEFIQTAFFLQTNSFVPSNVMVITNAGGPGVNTIDLLEHAGVSLARWSSKSKENITDHLPKVQANNPLDILGDANTDRFQLAVQQAQADHQVDAMLCIITQQAVTDIGKIVDMLIAKKGRKPLFVALLGGAGFEVYRKKLRQAGIVSASYPDSIVNMLKMLSQVHQAKTFTKPYLPSIYSSKENQSQIAHPSIQEAFELLKEYEIDVAKFAVIRQSKDVQSVPIPSFAKTANLSLKHKKQMGAIYGIVHSVTEAKTAYQQMAKFGNEVLYQEVVKIDVELLIGINNDPHMGTYLAFGLGGSDTNIIADRAYIYLPARRSEIRSAFEQTKAWEILEKWQSEQSGKKVVRAQQTVLDVAQKLQRLIMAHPEITELEINPLVVNTQGVWVADIKISL